MTFQKLHSSVAESYKLGRSVLEIGLHMILAEVSV
ncbi:hypothetical protein SAMN05192552_1001270 [Natrinema hispanicum]|uniref:Uncharacterized protein n=1 Tax=Natrinema hispanicum TaxID=392421 RepID=A0A1G6II22_9EURY|nr:hypothetical protein SAMN05192552_1001270 [Natrinema hispanicum]